MSVLTDCTTPSGTDDHRPLERFLSVRALTKTYADGFTAVAGLDLEIAPGRFFGLLGPNGAGKTTLIGSVCNLVRLARGSVHARASRQLGQAHGNPEERPAPSG